MPTMSGGSQFTVFFSDERRRAILRGLFDSYYAHIPADRVVFDTNRTWTAKAALLADLYPQARIICCVRDIHWIIDSIERMLRKNPLQLSRIFNFRPGSSIYSRVEILMNSDKGIVGAAWGSLREAWFSGDANRLIAVNYENLAREPETIVNRLYEELGEAPFKHDYDNVVYDEPEYDAELGMPGLHTVRQKVEHQKRESCIPPDLINRYSSLNFWLKPDMNPRGVIIL